MNSAKRHKHRRSNSTNLQSFKQNSSHFQQQTIPQPGLSDVSVPAVTVMQCIQNTNHKNYDKSIIVQQLNIVDNTVHPMRKKIKCLQQIQEDLIKWDQFQQSFLHIKLNKKIQQQSLREKKKKNYYRHQQFFQCQKQDQEFLLYQNQTNIKKHLRTK